MIQEDLEIFFIWRQKVTDYDKVFVNWRLEGKVPNFVFNINIYIVVKTKTYIGNDITIETEVNDESFIEIRTKVNDDFQNFVVAIRVVRWTYWIVMKADKVDGIVILRLENGPNVLAIGNKAVAIEKIMTKAILVC